MLVREYKNVTTGEMTSSSNKLKEWLTYAMIEKDKMEAVTYLRLRQHQTILLG